MELFDSLVLSVLFYTLTIVPMKSKYVEWLENFVIRYYKKMLKIDTDFRIQEPDLARILKTELIKNQWRKINVNSASHIARLPFNNPSRIVLFGKPKHINEKRPRKFITVKESLMIEIMKHASKDTLCNLCDTKIRRAIYT